MDVGGGGGGGDSIGHLLQHTLKLRQISPGLIFAEKAFFTGFIFGGAYFRTGLLSEGILRFKMGLACQQKKKTAKDTRITA